MAYSIDSVDELTQLSSLLGVSEPFGAKVEECLLNKSLCTLMSMGQHNQPKTSSKLENALKPCTVVVPYANPLDALTAVNKSSKQPTPSVNIPHAKKRVYVEMKKVKDAHTELLKQNERCKVAPKQSSLEKMITDDVIAWIHSDPEGTEEELISKLVTRCSIKCRELFPMGYTVPPSRLFSENMKHLKQRRVQRVVEGSSASEKKMTTEFAIGVFPGENQIKEKIRVTPEGLTGIEVSITSGGYLGGASTARRGKGKFLGTRPTTKKPDKTMRAVGQCKGFKQFFRNRLSVAVRGCNAILIPATEYEKIDMVHKVAEWINLVHRSSDQHGAVAEAQHTVADLQQQLIKNCVGKVRHLAPSTITDLLQKAGFITIDDEQSVTYQLPTDRNKKPSWREDTVEAAVASCKCSGMLRKAFSRKNGKDSRQMPDVNSTPQMQSISSAARYEPNYNDLTDMYGESDDSDDDWPWDDNDRDDDDDNCDWGWKVVHNVTPYECFLLNQFLKELDVDTE